MTPREGRKNTEMRTILEVVFLCFSFISLGAPISRVGDHVPNICWEDALAKKTCLSDLAGKTAVLVYNAGWCGPCNTEFKGLAEAMEKYAPPQKPDVVFLSLSCEGWRSRSKPDAAFLNEWDTKHGLTSAKATFLVLASPRDCGRQFFSSPSIPNAAVIAGDGILSWKGISPSYRELIRQIDVVSGP